MSFKDIGKTEDDREISFYTSAGNVFDTPEHQAILSKMTNIDDRIAYKRKILNQQHFEKYGKYIDSDW